MTAGVGVLVLTNDRPVLVEDFDGQARPWVSANQFWGDPDGGLEDNQDWYANAGSLEIRDGKAHTDDDQFRMYSRRTDLTDPSVTFDMVFHGFTGGTGDDRGLSVWLNRTHCTPVPACSAVDDADGNTGYMLRFVSAEGSLILNKKIAGDTRERLPDGATSYVQGGTYYFMDKVDWRPQVGRGYELRASVEDNGDGPRTISAHADGGLLLEVVDDGTRGGPPLAGGRVGLRSDFADVTIDDLKVRR